MLSGARIITVFVRESDGWAYRYSLLGLAQIYLVHRPKSIVNENVGNCLDTILAFKVLKYVSHALRQL